MIAVTGTLAPETIADLLNVLPGKGADAKTPDTFRERRTRRLPIDSESLEGSRIINVADKNVRDVESQLRDMVFTTDPSLFSRRPSLSGSGTLSELFRDAVDNIKIRADIETKSKLVVTVSDERNVNACIMLHQDPAVICVNRGLLKYVQNMDELAGIIAHEMAHKRLRDRYKIITNATKAEELGTDIEGLEWAARAGFNPMAIIRFWQRLAKDHEDGKEDIYGLINRMKEAHPDIGNRIAMLEMKLSNHTLFDEKFPLNLTSVTPLTQEILELNRRDEKLHISHFDRNTPENFTDFSALEQLRALKDLVNNWYDRMPLARRYDVIEALGEIDLNINDDAQNDALTDLIEAARKKITDKDNLVTWEMIYATRKAGYKNSDVDTPPAFPGGPLRKITRAAAEFSCVCADAIRAAETGHAPDQDALTAAAAVLNTELKAREDLFKRTDANSPTGLSTAGDVIVINHFQRAGLATPDHDALKKIEILYPYLHQNREAALAIWSLNGSADETFWHDLPLEMLETFKGTRVIQGWRPDAVRDGTITDWIRAQHERVRREANEKLSPTVDFKSWIEVLGPDLIVLDPQMHVGTNARNKGVVRHHFARERVGAYFREELTKNPDNPVVLDQLRIVLNDYLLPALKEREKDPDANWRYSHPDDQLKFNDPLMRIARHYGAQVMKSDDFWKLMSYQRMDLFDILEAREFLSTPEYESIGEMGKFHELRSVANMGNFGAFFASADIQEVMMRREFTVLSDEFFQYIGLLYNEGPLHSTYLTAPQDAQVLMRKLYAPPMDKLENFVARLNELKKNGISDEVLLHAYRELQSKNIFPSTMHRQAMVDHLIAGITAKPPEDQLKISEGLLKNIHDVRDLKLRDALVGIFVREVSKPLLDMRDNKAPKDHYHSEIVKTVLKIDDKHGINGRDKPIILKKLADVLLIQPSQVPFFTIRDTTNELHLKAAHYPIGGFEEFLAEVAKSPELQGDTLDFLADGNTPSRDSLVTRILTDDKVFEVVKKEIPNLFAHGENRRDQIASYLDDVRAHYLASPLERRAAALSLILVPGKLRTDEAVYAAATEKAFNYVVGHILPGDGLEQNAARSFLKSFLKVSESFERVPLMAGMMAAASEGMAGEKFNTGVMLARVFSQLGPAYVKLGQGMHSHPDCPAAWREPLSKLKGQAIDEARWDLLTRIKDTLPRHQYWQISHFGEILGSASFNTAVRITMYGGRKRVLLLEHPGARARAKKGFNTLSGAVAGWDDPAIAPHKNVAVEMLNEGATLTDIETSKSAGDTQFKLAKSAYNNVTITVVDAGKPFRVSLFPVACHAAGNGYRIIDEAPGIHFEDLPEGHDKRLIAKAYFAYEMHRIAAGAPFDCDRHGQQLKVVRERDGSYRLGLYDYGGMDIKAPSADEIRALSKAAFDVAMKLKAGEHFDPSAQMAASIAAADPSVRPYLSRIRKSWLAIQDFARELDAQDLRDVADSILAAPLSRDMVADVVARAGADAAPRTLGDKLRVLTDAFMQGSPKPVITFAKNGRTLRPSLPRRMVQDHIRAAFKAPS